MGLTGGETSSDHHQHQDWGMGIFFIFFPEDHHDPNAAARKKNQPPLIGSLKRINSTHLLSTAQSTISICALLVFITLLFFTLSTFESSSSSPSNSGRLLQYSSRRQLRNVDNGSLLKQQKKVRRFPAPAHALQGMGSLYRRGSKSMSDLVVVHVVESLNLHELKLFLRLFFGSALNSRADLLFLFPAKSVAFDNVILDESDSFFKMVAGVGNASRNSSVPQFLKRSKNDKAAGEPIWGGKVRGNSSAGGNQTESTRVSYGSVVGFDVDELDPENSLAGFMDYHVPMNLRRWACYPMLLGRLRRNFKHIMLVDIKEWVIVGDGMGRVRAGSPETVHLSTAVPQAVPARHGKKGSEKAQPGHAKSVSPAVIRGGARGVRRVSQAMLNEIVRATVAKKKKNSVTESGVFNQLVGNEFLLKNVKLITSAESVPELSSLAAGSHSKNVTVARRGNSNFSVNSTALKDILCSSPLHNSVYSNCL